MYTLTRLCCRTRFARAGRPAARFIVYRDIETLPEEMKQPPQLARIILSNRIQEFTDESPRIFVSVRGTTR